MILPRRGWRRVLALGLLVLAASACSRAAVVSPSTSDWGQANAPSSVPDPAAARAVAEKFVEAIQRARWGDARDAMTLDARERWSFEALEHSLAEEAAHPHVYALEHVERTTARVYRPDPPGQPLRGCLDPGEPWEREQWGFTFVSNRDDSHFYVGVTDFEFPSSGCSQGSPTPVSVRYRVFDWMRHPS